MREAATCGEHTSIGREYAGNGQRLRRVSWVVIRRKYRHESQFAVDWVSEHPDWEDNGGADYFIADYAKAFSAKEPLEFDVARVFLKMVEERLKRSGSSRRTTERGSGTRVRPYARCGRRMRLHV